MKRFLNLLGKRDDAPSGIGVEIEIDEFSPSLVSIDALDFMGHMAAAPGGRFKLIWSDRDPETMRGGSREAGHGYWALLDGGHVTAEGRLERPQEGRVSDTGTFILHDWMFGNDLRSQFAAFRPDGDLIFSHEFVANVMNNGLSNDGRFAICQTANAPSSSDSCKYILFDLEAGGEVARWDSETGWTSGYAFDVANRLVRLFHKDDETVEYGFDGQMVDRGEWQDRRIANGDIVVIRSVLEAAGSEIDEALRAKLRAGLDHAERCGEFWQKAAALRLSGELYEHVGELPAALVSYDQALLLDPQIGVSRRADKIRKALAPRGGAGSSQRLSRFERQAERLGIRHEVVHLESGGPKAWRHDAADSFTSIEAAALASYRAEGWSGAAAEGVLILTVIKAASFRPLQQRHADTFIEALYAQNVSFAEDRFDIDALLSTCAWADQAQLEKNWQLISATTQISPAFYATVRREHVRDLFNALGAERLTEIARLFSSVPYELRSGWPDLTLWRGQEVRFVEVKGPGDSMHATQARLISAILAPLTLDIALAEVRAR